MQVDVGQSGQNHHNRNFKDYKIQVPRAFPPEGEGGKLWTQVPGALHLLENLPRSGCPLVFANVWPLLT